jgi:hypothetical protein
MKERLTGLATRLGAGFAHVATSVGARAMFAACSERAMMFFLLADSMFRF